MKRAFVLLAALLSASLPLAALQAGSGASLPDGRIFGITLAPVYTYLNGRSYELVLQSASFDNSYLSKLNWDLENIHLLGNSLSLNWKDRLFLNFAFASALNSESGQMYNFDWLYGTYPQADRTTWTNRSSSDIDLTSSFLMDSNFTLRFHRSASRSLDALYGLKRMHWAWTDTVTSVDYPYAESDSSSLIGENGIDYQVSYRIPYAGIGYTEYRGSWEAGLTVLFSWMVSVQGHDNHKYPLSPDTERHFYDFFSRGRYWGVSLHCRWNGTERLSLSLRYDWDHIPEITGDTRIETESGSVTTLGFVEDGAGTAYAAASLTAAVEFRF